MALENLKDIFEQAGFGGGAPISDPTPPEEQTPDVSKIEQLYKPDSKVASKITFGNPTTTNYTLGTGIHSGLETYDSDNIKKRSFDISTLGKNQELGLGDYVFKSLYNVNHTAVTDREQIDTGRKDFEGNPILINTLRSGMGGLDKLNIKGYSDGFRIGAFATPEPYIISEIGSDRYKSSNRDFLALNRSLDDTSRLLTFYGSGAGLSSIAKENIINFAIGDGIPIDNPLSAIMAPPVPVPNTGFLNFVQQSVQGASLIPGGGSIRKPFRIQYSDRTNFGGFPFKNLGDKPIGLGVLATIKLPQGSGKLASLGRKILKPVRDAGFKELARVAQIPKVERPTPFIDLSGGPKNTRYEDIFSLTSEIDESEVDLFEPEITKGDFYVKIKDLRTNQFLYFRGYVTGITENVSPSFTSINYIGRSEPVYVYEKADRDLSFNLKVYPANFTEQDAMYKKIEHLTSLAYPEYMDDGGLTRMKPPFTELYMAHIGSRKQGQFGFIKSITYNVSDQGDWDSERMLPRLFDIAISYQILSKRPPSLRDDHKFYGGERGVYG